MRRIIPVAPARTDRAFAVGGFGGCVMQQSQNRLEMKHITKHFGGVKALTDVSLEVRQGEIHALVGENGAGKSTLMKVLSGAYQKDSGDIFIDGQLVNIQSPRDAKSIGISVIYQEFMLAPDLTVAENIYIDQLASKKGIINWRALEEKAGAQLAQLGFNEISPKAHVKDLSVAYQQVVEICKNLTRDVKVLVLDEPTAVLTFAEIERLFAVLKQLKERGVSIIYISHRLDEIFSLSERITVLRDGQLVGTVKTECTDKKHLVSMMVGREMSQMFPERHAVIGEEVLRAEDVCAGEMAQNVSFSVRSGEVLGFSGLVGSGRTETMRAIFGADIMDSGRIFYLGKEVRFKSPGDSIKHGFGMLPESRKDQGLLLQLSIRINTTLTVLKRKVAKCGVIDHKREKSYSAELLKSIATKYGSLEDHTDSLSGGNQQKVSLAKWIAADCRCLIFDEPTRGVDVGAKTEIYNIINGLAEKGVAIIIISSEMPEIIGMCDRVMVMRAGEIAAEFSGEEITENNLIKAAMGVE